MAALNQVTICGNLTRDPQLKQAGQTQLAEFGMALSESYFNKQTQQKVETTVFVDVVAWGKTGEIASQYLSKGSQVLISGKLKFDSWTDKTTGSKRSKLSVTCQQLVLLGKGGGSPQQGGQQPQQQQSSTNAPPDKTEDVPF